MRNRLERRRLTLRAAALCIVLVLLCCCLLPAFAEGPERTDSVPDQTWDEEIEDEPAGDEEDDIRTDEPVLLPAEDGIPVVVDGLDDIGLPDETPTPDSGAVKADEHFERTYLFWLSESDEADGGLPYAEQIVGSGEELLMPEEPEVEGKSFRFWYSRDDEGTAIRFMPDEGLLWPEADSECSLYASFTDDEAQQEEPVLDEEEDIAVLPELWEERPVAVPPRMKRLWMRQNSPKKTDSLRKMPTWLTTAQPRIKMPCLRTNLMRMHRAGAIGLRKSRRESSCSRPPPVCPAAMTPASGRRTTASASGSAR